MDNTAHEPYTTWIRTIGPRWDYLFSFDPGITNQFPQDTHTKVVGIPVGINPDAYRSVQISDTDRRRFTCQICFVGAPYPNRVVLLSQITDLDLKIFGWPGWKNTSLAKYYHGPLNATESAMAYRCAKICVNTNVLPHASGVNLKTFEICAAGGFQLTDECADLKTLFAIGSEVDIFHDSEEFRRKVDYWLEHDDERQRVASAGNVRAIRDHSIQKRVHQLLNIVIGK
jgi:spore maturation protein CgeB